MDGTCNSVKDLVELLREDGDKILNASSKLSISSTLLYGLNNSFNQLFAQNHQHNRRRNFHVVNTSGDIIDSFLDLQFIYEFFQKTLALKVLPGQRPSQVVVDVGVFHSLKLLEVQRFSLCLVKGLKELRNQLEYLICKRSLRTLREVLERCGGDGCQGFVWSGLKEAVFSHNGLKTLDNSLEFIPCLENLDLSHNKISEVKQLDCLSNSLKCLNLSFNQLESFPNFSRNSFNNLKSLILKNNYIETIDEVSLLHNLQELDLSHNSLLSHTSLTPLSNLPNLNKLNLIGNPLYYHKNHRKLTASRLHCNAANIRFQLDHRRFSAAELRLVGSVQPHPDTLERSESFNSTTTASTVVPAKVNVAETETEKERKEPATLLHQVLGKDLMVGMQDSGFEADVRAPSPSSECSIGPYVHPEGSEFMMTVMDGPNLPAEDLESKTGVTVVASINDCNIGPYVYPEGSDFMITVMDGNCANNWNAGPNLPVEDLESKTGVTVVATINDCNIGSYIPAEDFESTTVLTFDASTNDGHAGPYLSTEDSESPMAVTVNASAYSGNIAPNFLVEDSESAIAGTVCASSHDGIKGPYLTAEGSESPVAVDPSANDNNIGPYLYVEDSNFTTVVTDDVSTNDDKTGPSLPAGGSKCAMPVTLGASAHIGNKGPYLPATSSESIILVTVDASINDGNTGPYLPAEDSESTMVVTVDASTNDGNTGPYLSAEGSECAMAVTVDASANNGGIGPHLPAESSESTVSADLSANDNNIGSARSLTSSDDELAGTTATRTVRYCESDIEVLSNPSQSSIEVLSGGLILNHIQSNSETILDETILKRNLSGGLEEGNNEL